MKNKAKILSIFLIPIYFVIIIFSILFFIKNDIETIYNKNLIPLNNECFTTTYLKNRKVDCKPIRSILNKKQNNWSLVFDSNEEILMSADTITVSFKKDTAYIIVDYKHKVYGWISIISEKEFKNFREKSEIFDINKELNKKIESNLKN
jgi:hypothetical protein